MTTSLHRDLVPSERHAPHSFEFPNQAAREGATGLVAADIGKQALQTDNNTVYLLIATTPTWLQLTPGAQRNHKAGVLIPGDFSGSPRTATVTFATAYPNLNYSVNAEAVTINGRRYVLNVASKAVGSFVVGLGSSAIGDLVEVLWQTIDQGE